MSPAAASSGWGRPLRLASPSPLDVIPAQVAFSASGAAALGFGVEDIDNPSTSAAYAASGPAPARLGNPSRVRGAQQTLALGYAGTDLAVLVGTSPSGVACCRSVDAVKAAISGGFGAGRKLVSGLVGAAAGRLVSLPGRLLAAIASGQGVWVSQTGADGRFAAARRLTGSSVLPEALDAVSLRGGNSVVAWTASRPQIPSAPGATTAPGAGTIFVARGSLQHAPRGASAALTVPTGHWIDEFALAGGRLPTLAWIESWFDATGIYRSVTEVADLGQTVQPLSVSPPGELASGLAFASNTSGDQALVWKGCTTAGACVLRDTLRAAGGRFGAPQQLGPADASQAPAVAVAPTGQALAAWIQNGHVLAAQARAHAAGFGRAQFVSRTNYAADVALAFGPAGQALATWTQGTLAESVMGAVYRLR